MQNFLENKNIKHYSRNTSLGDVFAELFNRTIRDLPRKPVFEEAEGNSIDVFFVLTKQYNNQVHTSNKLTPIQSCLKTNEGYVYKNLLDKQQKIKPKLQVNNLVTTAELKGTFSNCDTSNWSYKLYKITEINNNKIMSCHIDKLPE